ncbi:endonuclease/exonuclease/phosphatase family protein [Aurantibacter crassamenti]|uniref:endonuclease/exonuclease/phosphatase family protein n=1 Tax=Aurantibacter crassamenti TaxID=1837375 RepID=UPI00193A1F6F|nr:endonuclease/exonuclease/phosphatase family protein [Aurantibacter crassamenti]MBM1104895.1 endonuclease/exonuclease/phosphatase family protein [Aurantibacter crassamenti]
MKSKYIILFLFFPFLFFAQEETKYHIRTIAFYNVENLFDIENDTLIFDDDRTPDGKDNWTINRYNKKIKDLAKVLSEIGVDETNTSPDIIGLSEVENIKVLEDLVNNELLRNKGYQIVHFDSPDERGIDVALLYKESAFLPTSFESHRLLLINEDNERNYTRDQLVVGGLLDDEQMHFIINHWPSRSGGEARSKPNRMKAAKLNKRIIDSLQKTDSFARIISMGDLNDDPTDDSLKKILKTTGKSNNINDIDLFNPMEKLYKKGIGSLAYRDKWNLFDQIFFTGNLLNSENNYHFWKAGVFNPNYLITRKGQYKGYPFRTYAGGNYAGGYSDHFPVYMYLIKATKN